MKNKESLKVLFENDQILALDKPSGLLVVQDRWDKQQETLLNLVRSYLGRDAWPVHRLDKEASGVVLFTKDSKTRTFLEKQFQDRQVKKIYHALVRGEVDQAKGIIQLDLAEDLEHPGRMRVGGKNAKSSVTDFEILEAFKGVTYLKVMPVTGRQHQIRVSLQAMGSPVLCDSLYGSDRAYYLSEMKRFYKRKKDEPEKPLINRLALHAYQTTFLAEDGISQTVESPLPKDFVVFLKYLRKFWK